MTDVSNIAPMANCTMLCVVQDPPFVMHRSNGNESACSGNECYFGYSIDLLEKLASELSFNYEIYIASDGKYGVMNEVTRKWNGLVGELIPNKNGETVSYMKYTSVIQGQ